MTENPDDGHYDPAMDDYEQEDECPNCGGEGVVYSCFEEWACVDPEGGCDLCMRRCDWCNQKKKGAEFNDVDAQLREGAERFLDAMAGKK